MVISPSVSSPAVWNQSSIASQNDRAISNFLSCSKAACFLSSVSTAHCPYIVHLSAISDSGTDTPITHSDLKLLNQTRSGSKRNTDRKLWALSLRAGIKVVSAVMSFQRNSKHGRVGWVFCLQVVLIFFSFCLCLLQCYYYYSITTVLFLNGYLCLFHLTF